MSQIPNPVSTGQVLFVNLVGSNFFTWQKGAGIILYSVNFVGISAASEPMGHKV